MIDDSSIALNKNTSNRDFIKTLCNNFKDQRQVQIPVAGDERQQV